MDAQASIASMDTSPSRSCDTSPKFVSLTRSPHDVAPLLPNPSTHLLHEMPTLFPNGGDSPSTMNNVRQQVSIPDLPVNMAMDVLSSSTQPLGPAPGFIPDFQQQCVSFGISARLDSDIGMGPSTIHPSASDSQVSSPSIHTITPSYSVGSSSLATALDNSMGRSRAGSTASTQKLMSSISPTGYLGNGGLPSVDSTGILFPSTDFSSGLNGRHDNLPDIGNDQPHMVKVGQVLGRYVCLLSSYLCPLVLTNFDQPRWMFSRPC